jgi:hypothetical protein
MQQNKTFLAEHLVEHRLSASLIEHPRKNSP